MKIQNVVGASSPCAKFHTISSAPPSTWKMVGDFSGSRITKTCQPAADWANAPFCEWLMENNWEKPDEP